MVEGEVFSVEVEPLRVGHMVLLPEIRVPMAWMLKVRELMVQVLGTP